MYGFGFAATGRSTCGGDDDGGAAVSDAGLMFDAPTSIVVGGLELTPIE